VRRQIIDEEDLGKLAGAVVAILERQGVRVEHEGALDALEEAGLPVDRSRHVVRFREEDVTAFVEGRPDRGCHRLLGVPPHEYSTGMGYEIDPYYYDYATRSARLGTREDLITLVRLGHVLEEVSQVGAPVVMGDVDPRIEPVEAMVTCALCTNKPVSGVTLYPEHNKYFIEIADILYDTVNDTRFIGTGGFITSPLTVSGRVCDLIFAARDLGLKRVSCGTMAIAGMSAPVTPAGCAAVAAAEILGGWLVARAINGDIEQFTGGTCTGVLDMRTMRACFGAPEAALQDAAVALLFADHFGGGVGVAGLGYTDAQVPGLQCAYEKMFKGVCIAGALGQPLRVHNPGIIDAGRTFSPTQFMLDIELDQSLWQFDRGIEVTENALGLDAVWEAGIRSGAEGFLGTRHTLENYRSAIWYPQLLDRRTDSKLGGGAEAPILTKAEQRWKDAVARYEGPEMDAAKVTALKEVVERARSDLL